uniref:Inhibitor_I29 domain-containing protein n=1 Tax=Globodera pallida TaxID=36090 RepID=A0A183CFJ4_GLOPA
MRDVFDLLRDIWNFWTFELWLLIVLVALPSSSFALQIKDSGLDELNKNGAAETRAKFEYSMRETYGGLDAQSLDAYIQKAKTNGTIFDALIRHNHVMYNNGNNLRLNATQRILMGKQRCAGRRTASAAVTAPKGRQGTKGRDMTKGWPKKRQRRRHTKVSIRLRISGAKSRAKEAGTELAEEKQPSPKRQAKNAGGAGGGSVWNIVFFFGRV